MTKKYNFNPGPSILPPEVIKNTAKAVLDLDDIGLSVMEISHRSKEFKDIMYETIALFKEILEIPEGYHVLFLGGGASMQFCMLAYNLLNSKAAYLETGAWAQKAAKEAELFGKVEIIASSADKNFGYIPRDFVIPDDVDYFHITTNNTTFGTEIKEDITSPVPLVADMSSDIFSRPMDVSKYALIYGGAQKNIGPAGITFVIVRQDVLGKVKRQIPTMLDYRTHIKKDSMFNTPPCLSIYACLETMRWIKKFGGLQKIKEHNEEKASLIYDEIDRNSLFTGSVEKDSRSIMNACFVMRPEYKDLEKEFLEFTVQKNIIGIKGHSSVGGFRASIYNAMPKENVKVLVEAMKEFEERHIL